VCRPRITKLEGVAKQLREIRDDLEKDIKLKVVPALSLLQLYVQTSCK